MTLQTIGRKADFEVQSIATTNPHDRHAFAAASAKAATNTSGALLITRTGSTITVLEDLLPQSDAFSSLQYPFQT
jgi:hypothetical protein